jgi:uncharacterized protein involved in exopolysaccharide biosynthesis
VPGSEGTDANFVDILQSRWMAESLMSTQFKFKARSWRFGPERETTATLYEYLNKKNMDVALREFQKMMQVSKDLKSKVITISVETKSPTLSQEVVRKSSELLETFIKQKGRTQGGAKAVFAEERLVEARSEMGQAENELRGFLEQNRNYASSADPSVRLRGMRLETELKLHQQVVTTLALNREQALMEEKDDIPIINLLDVGNLPIEKNRPSRASITLGVTIFVFFSAWGWAMRDFLLALLRAE